MTQDITTLCHRSTACRSTTNIRRTERPAEVRLEVYCKKCFCHTKTSLPFAPGGRKCGFGKYVLHYVII